MIHTILPIEGLMPQDELPQCECVSCPYGWVQGVRQPDGRLSIERVISTDPAAYLDEGMTPGSFFS